MKRVISLLLVALALTVNAASAAPPTPGADVEKRVAQLAAKLRCPVCQNLSVQDSPSSVATSLRDRIRELVLAGRSDDEVLAFFEARYGTWILLEPPRSGISLALWLAPLLLVAGALAITVSAVRRWTARARRLEEAGRARPQALAASYATLTALERGDTPQ